MRLVWLLGLTLSALAVTPPASAAPDRAEILIREAVELRKKGRNAEALSRYQAAYEMAHTARAAAQLGLCLAALEKWVDADAYLTESLVSSDPWIDRNRQVLDATAASVRGHLVTVKIGGGPAGAAVRVNGEPIGRLPATAPVRVLPGEITAIATFEGHDAQRETKPGNAGETIVFEFKLQPTAAPRAADSTTLTTSPPTDAVQPIVSAAPDHSTTSGSWLRPASYVSGGLALASLAVGVLSHVQREQATSDFRGGSCNELPNGTITGGRACEDAADRFESANTRTLIGYIGAGALGAAAVTMYILGGSKSQGGVSVASCAPRAFDRFGIGCQFRF